MVHLNKPNPAAKQLLSDLEFYGGRRKAFFQDICNHKEGFYGQPGSLIRRKYQQAVDRLVRRYSAVKYKGIVEENGVAPAAATIEDAMEELKKAMEKTALIDEDDKAPAKAPGKKVTMKDTPTQARATTPPPPIGSLFTPPSSPGIFKSLQSPEASVTSATEGIDDLSVDPTVGWTASNPHIVPVTKGNAHLPHGFVSMYSDSVRGFGTHERDIYILSKVIGGDLQHWKASVPKGFGEYRNRCILVEGPALDYIQGNSKVMLDSLKETCNLHGNTITAALSEAFSRGVTKLKNHFKRSNDKHSQFYLFVYPPSVVFDNTAISGDGAAEKVKTHGIKINSKFGIFTRDKHTNMVCFWAIATQADEDRRMDDIDDVLSEDVFGF